ncbi:GtrA family protein [Kluyvera cryocrescens]|uniref:GtrA family protein n=1 Tax=Kluyvera cryocrescens TaxID=580 RepID=UPI0039F6E03A
MNINLYTLYKNQAIRYCIVGFANTALTAAIIFYLTAIGLNLYIANISGYIFGVFLSFILNIYFTFSSKPSFQKLIKFLASCFICYLVNLIAIKTSLTVIPDNLYIVQLIGMLFYTAFGFLINKYWVIK